MSAFLASRATTIFALLERAHHPRSVGTNVPNNSRSVRSVQTIADAVSTCVKQGLPCTVAVILNAVAVATILLRSIVNVTEPRAIFKGQPADPFVLDLRKRLNAQIGIEVLPVCEARQTIITLAYARHAKLELPDSSRNADT